MKSLVHGRTGQVVHGRVNDAKILLLAGLEVKHFSHANSCIANQRPAGLDH